jgi:SAM-dependent methyltransferase
VARALSRSEGKRWLERWDLQQESFNATREQRFRAMFDAVEATVGRRFQAVDLGAGPGSLSIRLLARFPAARATALDYDPVVRAVGEGAVGTLGGRLTWVDAKLGAPGWRRTLPRSRYDAALSTTALHWLRRDALGALYRDLARVVRSGGVFLNGDYLAWGPRDPRFRRLGWRVSRIRMKRSGIRPSREWHGWKEWWVAARRVPALAEAFAEHDRREAGHPHGQAEPSLADHVRYLRAAGFRSVDVVWQDFENRVLMAIR